MCGPLRCKVRKNAYIEAYHFAASEVFMIDGKCPSCGSHEIHMDRCHIGSRNCLIMGLNRKVRLFNCVCAQCGRVESYVENRADLETIKLLPRLAPRQTQ